MQTLEVRATTALNEPRRISAFRALVWKEWRQQKWIFLSLAVLAYAPLILSLIVVSSDEHNNTLWRDVLRCFAVLIGTVGIIILSANAFSGEREDNTEQFLAMIPCSRGKLFSVKLGFVLCLVLLELVPLAAAALIYGGRPQPADFIAFENAIESQGLGLAAAVLVLAIIPALVASFGGSVIATILVSIPVATGCALWTVYSPMLLQGLLPARGATAPANREAFLALAGSCPRAARQPLHSCSRFSPR